MFTWDLVHPIARCSLICSITLHESGKTLWPWTGFENEIGDGEGKDYNVNVPLPMGICDEAYLEIFNKIVIPLAKSYDPDVFVLQLGMDALAGDLLAHLELTNNVHAFNDGRNTTHEYRLG